MLTCISRYLKQTAVILRDKFNGDIPSTLKGLVSLPGVGPKMAHLCLSAAWDRTEGIGVDVHVHRITNMWGWHRTRTPEESRIALEAWLPREKWREINWLLVGFGQTVCPSVGRRCGECEVGLTGLCGAADRGKVAAGRRVKMEAVVKVDEGGVKPEGEKVKPEGDMKVEGVEVKVEEGEEGSGMASVVKKEESE